jgi:hypothetical protein
MMRKIAAAAFFLLLIAGPAFAQEEPHMQGYREEPKEKTQTQINAEKQAARDYQRSLNNVPNQKQVDPWGIARSDDAKKPAAPAKPAMKSSKAKTETKAGGTTN